MFSKVVDGVATTIVFKLGQGVWLKTMNVAPGIKVDLVVVANVSFE